MVVLVVALKLMRLKGRRGLREGGAAGPFGRSTASWSQSLYGFVFTSRRRDQLIESTVSFVVVVFCSRLLPSLPPSLPSFLSAFLLLSHRPAKLPGLLSLFPCSVGLRGDAWFLGVNMRKVAMSTPT